MSYKTNNIYIIKIDYDNGQCFVMMSKDPYMTKYSLDKALRTGKAPKNYWHETYMLKNKTKYTGITIIEENVSYKHKDKLEKMYRRTYNSIEPTYAEYAAIICEAARNKLNDALHPGIPDEHKYIGMLINAFSTEPDMLDIICNKAYKMTGGVKEFQEYVPIEDLIQHSPFFTK